MKKSHHKHRQAEKMNEYYFRSDFFVHCLVLPVTLFNKAVLIHYLVILSRVDSHNLLLVQAKIEVWLLQLHLE